MFLSKIPALAPGLCIFSPRKYELSGPLPSGPFWSALYRYAENAPGKTEMYPQID